jgi:hypothetical protein
MAESSFAQLAARYKALPRQQQLIVAFGVPVVIAGLFIWMTAKDLAKLGPDEAVPKLIQRTNAGLSLWEQIEALKIEIAEKDVIIAQRDSIAAQLAELQVDIDAAESKLPRQAEKALMREVIQRLAREVPADLGVVQIKSVRISEDGGGGRSGRTSSRGELSTLTYQTELLADTNGLIKFIDLIEKNERFMTVNTISLQAGEVTADLTAEVPKPEYKPHRVRLDIVTYVYAKKGEK